MLDAALRLVELQAGAGIAARAIHSVSALTPHCLRTTAAAKTPRHRPELTWCGAYSYSSTWYDGHL
jgi:hypothetical protein